MLDQMLNNKNCLPNNGDSDVKRKTEYIISGQEQTKKQPTAKEQVEILLRFLTRVFLLLFTEVAKLGTTLSSLRFDFAIENIFQFAQTNKNNSNDVYNTLITKTAITVFVLTDINDDTPTIKMVINA